MSVPPGLSAATANLYRRLTTLRGKRIVHSHGVGFAATLIPHAMGGSGASLLDDPTPRRAIVRLSRAGGLPEPLPDVLGVAVRVTDVYGTGRHQDFLLVSSAKWPLARRLLVPGFGFPGRWYSSLLPYRVGGELVLVGAVGLGAGEGVASGLADLSRRSAAGLWFQLALARPWGSWREVAALQVGERLPDREAEEIPFDPSNTGGGIELAGLLNELRPPAYRGSQDARAAGSPRLPGG